MTERTTRRGGLNEARILDAALELVDRGGVEGLSMRRLGTALGVDPMAVYHHVGGKQEIVLRLVERVFAGFEPPEPTGEWQEDVRSWARSYRRLAAEHPGLVLAIVSDPQAVEVASARVEEPLLDALTRAGLAEEGIEAATTALVDYVHGAVLPLARLAAPSAEAAVDAQSFQATLQVGFERGLDVIVAGVQASVQGQ